ncbi:MAG: DUF2336 domain-containing protein [Bdellovibrionales bacterium]
MSKLQHTLPAMFALAHERSEGARIELAGMLADLFLNEETQLSLREEELVNELIEQLLQNRSPAVRAQLVKKFANAARMPRKMAMSFAYEDIEVARPILVTSQTLTDDDLITIIGMQSRDHAEAIAQRASINEAVADALVTTGDIRIMQIVAENMGAILSRKAINILSTSARFTAELRSPVMRRPEMTTEAAVDLYWWVSLDLRRYALKRFGINAGQVDEALAKTIETLLNYHKHDKDNDETMMQVADWITERQAMTTRILPQVLRMEHYRLFNVLLSRLSSLPLAMIDTIVAEMGGRGLAVLCRSLGLDKAGFVSLFLLSRGSRPGEQVVHPRELSYALAAFDRMSVTLAQDLLRTWKKDPTYILRKQDDIMLEA